VTARQYVAALLAAVAVLGGSAVIGSCGGATSRSAAEIKHLEELGKGRERVIKKLEHHRAPRLPGVSGEPAVITSSVR